ncbi:MAG: OsmC family protein [Sphingobacteriales bacterium]|nr:OsmC family protein [Sphingobacteriales bacterium]
MTLKRRATAVWNGTGLEGSGKLTSTSGILKDTPYSFAARFQSEDGKAGTNPEELIAAAHAGCFSMALSFQLSNAGFPPVSIHTEAIVSIEKGESGFGFTGIHLELEATIPGISEEKFQELAGVAKVNCPVSKALAAVPVTLSAKLNAQ